MNRSKIAVVAVLLLAIAGVVAWSWVNIVHTPEYDPEKAHLFLEHFHHRCQVDYSDEVCGDVIGTHHRACFTDHLEPTPPDEIDEKGPVLYDLESYLRCMNDAIDDGD